MFNLIHCTAILVTLFAFTSIAKAAATPVPTATAVVTTQAAPTATAVPRDSVPVSPDDIQPPNDTGDDMGMLPGTFKNSNPVKSSDTNGGVMASSTPANSEAIQATVTYLLANPTQTTQDDLSTGSIVNNMPAGKVIPVEVPPMATPVSAEPTSTPVALPTIKK